MDLRSQVKTELWDCSFEQGTKVDYLTEQEMRVYASSSESSDSSDSKDDIPGLNDAKWEPLITGRNLKDQLGAAEEDSTEMNSQDNLLSINGVHEKLGLSYKNSRKLNKIIDKQLPGHPKDVIKCVKALYGDMDFADFLVFAPECHYADKEQTI
ncbi:uncharacterized protein F5147DRAFT_656609 [Suillus discolor]|uniref:Uncharacterized protein n=1 Tax=Suillus discolor TaxID=1912936 RepID=A0A9P7EZH7_9AGAM|nr:uncharacterized protein F5147DRAFT_656609 [Suillus discolor]KAG2096551.1 hypothetical protein F5147DRAFT_656609 [Suillus discolor]